jgi:hypothetical protein
LLRLRKNKLQRKKAIASFLLLPEVKNDLLHYLTKKNLHHHLSGTLISGLMKLKDDFEFVSINVFNKKAEMLYSTDSTHAVFIKTF